MRQIKKITVYCASSAKVDQKYFESTKRIAEILVEQGITTVYGGGAVGLMGQLADTVIANGGQIIGVMPKFMHQVEWQHNGISDLILVEDMHERKKRFMIDADALIALPGGCGTLEELLEAITLKRLGVYVNPIIILNQDGYYDPLIEMLDKCVDQQFMRSEHRDIWTVITKPSQLIEAVQNAPTWSHSAIDFAAV
jgi:uncharacterized protein (TIGR00730 family)